MKSYFHIIFNLVNASKPLYTASAWFRLTFLCIFFVHAFPCLGSYGKVHVFELQIPGLVRMEAYLMCFHQLVAVGSDVFLFFFFADSREVSYKTYGRRKKQ